MLLETSVKEDFLEKFHHDLVDHELEKSNKLNLFILRIMNNAFAYNDLVELLGDNLCYFALSRTQVKELINAGKYNSLVTKAKKKLVEYAEKINEQPSNEGGELGEILLYCLLESHLKAPKILTKLEIKTSGQVFVHGADGVHLLKVTDTDYQLVLGESKLNADLSKGISEAFGSLKNLLDNNGEKLYFEMNLIDSQLVKESYSNEIYKCLAKLIIPSPREDETHIDYSFAIFLGFNVDITNEEIVMSNADFRTHIRQKIKNEVTKVVKSINNQINKSKFSGYNFYVYAIPFSNLAENRLEIVRKLRS
jgi:Cap4 SAVED domain